MNKIHDMLQADAGRGERAKVTIADVINRANGDLSAALWTTSHILEQQVSQKSGTSGSQFSLLLTRSEVPGQPGTYQPALCGGLPAPGY